MVNIEIFRIEIYSKVINDTLTFHSESESSQSLNSPDISITLWGFLQNSMSAMQKQASVQDNPFMLQEQRLLHSDFLQLHVVNSRMLLGAGSSFIN